MFKSAGWCLVDTARPNRSIFFHGLKADPPSIVVNSYGIFYFPLFFHEEEGGESEVFSRVDRSIDTNAEKKRIISRDITY